MLLRLKIRKIMNDHDNFDPDFYALFIILNLNSNF